MHLRMHPEFHVPAWLAKLVHAALLALLALLVFAVPRALAEQRLGGDDLATLGSPHPVVLPA